MFTTEQIRQLIADGRLELFYKDWYWRTLALQIIKEYHNECKASLEEYLIAHTPDPITVLENENKLLKEELEYYKKVLRDIKRSIPKEV